MPVELILSPDHDRARSLGWFLTAFIEHFCVHGPGDVQGERVHLDVEKTRTIVDQYALDGAGRRLYSTTALSRPKGYAKSEDAAFVVLCEVFAPVRFERWARGGEVFEWRDFRYEYRPGEPIGRRVTSPYVRCLATEESQAGNTYDNVHFNLTEGPLGEGLPRFAAGLTRVLLPDYGGEIVPSTAASASKDGGKESHVVFDEPHLYTSPELKRMYDTVGRNLRKRKAAEPWAQLTSTMYESGAGSVFEGVHGRAKLMAEQKLRGRQRLMWDHREAPPEVDETSRPALRAALREAYGPFSANLDLDGIIDDEFWNPEKDPEETRRYFFNQATAHRNAWVTLQQVRSCARPDLVIPEENPIAIFFDGSKSDDSTGLLGCDIESGHVMTLGKWEKPTGPEGDGWMVDRGDVDATVDRVFEDRNVVAFFADVKEFESYVDKWARKYGPRLTIQATTGKYEHAVAWDMRGHVFEFTKACEQTYADMDEGVLTHDGDSALERHLVNARRRPNRYGVSIAKETRSSRKKIDLAVCMIGVRHARRMVEASKAWQKRSEPKRGKRAGRVIGWS